jgi:hypothetical protein
MINQLMMSSVALVRPEEALSVSGVQLLQKHCIFETTAALLATFSP